ncbi:MAG: Endoribonuclease YbeY [Candidatus Scalindua arabica]|uniref:Endoribonuclease YbeY n=1 Tax=Candidatus Scalindua arabica TaxID=1127984 RepID=A0A941W4B7_9BACT|nr:Endoribonuclease YbeY [Candidatus Scalindua arabica]
MIIEIANLQKHYEIKSSRIRRVVKEVLSKEGKDASLSIALVDNSKIQELNKQYFGSDEVTDVISFPLSNNKNHLSGEIIVSVETAVDSAGKRNIGIEGEIVLYIIHGILHLFGYDDGKEGDARLMHEEESKILKALGYNVPRVEDGFL